MWEADSFVFQIERFSRQSGFSDRAVEREKKLCYNKTIMRKDRQVKI